MQYQTGNNINTGACPLCLSPPLIVCHEINVFWGECTLKLIVILSKTPQRYTQAFFEFLLTNSKSFEFRNSFTNSNSSSQIYSQTPKLWNSWKLSAKLFDELYNKTIAMTTWVRGNNNCFEQNISIMESEAHLPLIPRMNYDTSAVWFWRISSVNWGATAGKSVMVGL